MIYNRTSGSTSAKITTVVGITTTITSCPSNAVTVEAPSCSPHNQSSKEIAIGSGIGVPLGLALLATLFLLWKEHREVQRLRNEKHVAPYMKQTLQPSGEQQHMYTEQSRQELEEGRVSELDDAMRINEISLR